MTDLTSLTMMDAFNTSFSHTEFILLAFPGTTVSRSVLFIPFLVLYVMIWSGNSLLMYRIWVEPSLQYPMYWLISLLFAVNLYCTTSIMPKFLLGLAFGLNQVSLGGCLVQMFFIYSSLVFESALVLVMALDRFVAICRPLHYHTIMTKRLLIWLNVINMSRSVLLVSPVVITLSKAHFCRSNIIFSFACENLGLINLACGDVSSMHMLGLLVRTMVSVVDGGILLLSYIKILYTAMKLVSGKAQNKALNTCGTHLMVAALIYSCGILSRLGLSVSVTVQNMISVTYYLVPPAVNPLIYGLRVKEIRLCLKKSYGRNLVKEDRVGQGHT
ncbi:olfactory receptor 52K1-like [Xenopus laevis]|uniref:Olfactory receptor 52K1-like n=1 Tax=Xenopus laevis TaxID=8355 RepID=A0A8J1M879_XENLA|nr:olfactory receptor 52K1-like [Xenopus laevis]